MFSEKYMCWEGAGVLWKNMPQGGEKNIGEKFRLYLRGVFIGGLTTVYRFRNIASTGYNILSSTVYKQKIDLILQSTGFKIKPITVYRISINTPHLRVTNVDLIALLFSRLLWYWNIPHTGYDNSSMCFGVVNSCSKQCK